MNHIFDRCLGVVKTRAGRAGVLAGAGLLGTAAATWARAVMLMIAVALGGCASLPSDAGRPAASLRSDLADTALAKMAAAALPGDREALSGFHLLADGEEAFQTRLALIRRAEKSLDVQYYLIANDRTGLEFLAALREAAKRGVQVRILVDDLYATGEDALYARMAAHDNTEVRMFNPLPARGNSFVARVALSIGQLSRINHRMHNKLLVADGSFAVTGGRNIADEYFDRAGAAANFIDMDVLVSGAIVADLQRAFIGFWNSSHSYALQSLVGSGTGAVAAPGPSGAAAASGPAGEPGTDAAGEPAWFSAQTGTIAAPATLLADRPEKVDDSAGAVAAGHLALLDEARSEVIVSSPYFVPGEKARSVLREGLGRAVRVSILTNSLATTDEPIVHVGYTRHRADLLAAGVSINELMPDDESREEVPAATRFAGLSGSAGRLHGKLAVVDEATVFVGSMNLDRRSDSCNTEYGIVIRSAALARSVRAFLVRQIDERSFSVRLQAAGGGLRWIDRRGAQEASQAIEPAGNSRLGLGTRLAAHLVGEGML